MKAARQEVSIEANRTVIELYWKIGHYILSKQRWG
ncbi:MAG: hypothetical protein IPM82_31885 [Saprospiraceae bacterium]|nr:hypothetical protein [Saprospiraceae bacterium]